MSNSFVTPGTVACQACLSKGFLRQEYWSGLLFPSPGDLPDPGIKPVSSALSGWFFTTELPGKLDSMFLSSLFVSLRCIMDSLGLAWLLLNSWKGYFMSSGLTSAVNKPYNTHSLLGFQDRKQRREWMLEGVERGENRILGIMNILKWLELGGIRYKEN